MTIHVLSPSVSHHQLMIVKRPQAVAFHSASPTNTWFPVQHSRSSRRISVRAPRATAAIVPGAPEVDPFSDHCFTLQLLAFTCFCPPMLSVVFVFLHI